MMNVRIHPSSDVQSNAIGEGTRVWQYVAIGTNATIMGGVTIGDGAMVGAGSVVTKDVPPGAMVVGNPAREVKRKPCDRRPWRLPWLALGWALHGFRGSGWLRDGLPHRAVRSRPQHQGGADPLIPLAI